MIINNSYLIELLNKAIDRHNSDIESMKEFNEQTGLISKIDEINKQISDDDLSKLVRFSCDIDMEKISLVELQNLVKELPKVLEKMNLSFFSMLINNSSTNESINLDTQFINFLNENIKIIQLSEIDLSNCNSDLFNKFNNLEAIGLSKGNISDFDIISNFDSKVGVDLGENPLEKNMQPNDIVAEIRKRNGRMIFSYGSIYNQIAFAIADGKEIINVAEYTVIDDETFHIIGKLNEFEFYISENEMRKLRESKVDFSNNIKSNGKLVISSTSELDTKTLEENIAIKEIQIIDEQNRCDYEQEEPYTRDEFLKIRKKIDEIVSQVELPEFDDEDREKKIFMQVYRILGKKISYNEYAITEEGRKDERLMITCRNLHDGLLKGTAVCAGYADILRNVLSEFGIRAEYISKWLKSKEEYATTFDVSDYEVESYDENGPGHAWDVVNLDGKRYLCDLTADADKIQSDRYPWENCCASEEDFDILHEEFETSDYGEISEISYEQQLQLLGFPDEEIEKILNPTMEDFIKMLENIKEYENRNKMANCVLEISSEIKASDFDSIEQCFLEEKEEELDDKTN